MIRYGNNPSYAIYQPEDFRIHETNDEKQISISLTGKQLVYFDYRYQAFDGMDLQDYSKHFIEEFGEEPNSEVEFIYQEAYMHNTEEVIR